MSIADTFFNQSLRVETILWLAALSESPSDAFERFVENSDCTSTTKLITELLGITKKQWDRLAKDEAHEEIMTLIARRRLEGFLVNVSTPVPVEVFESGSVMTYGFGYTTARWFYTEQLDAAFVEKVAKWKEDYYEAEKKKLRKKAKKGGA